MAPVEYGIAVDEVPRKSVASSSDPLLTKEEKKSSMVRTFVTIVCLMAGAGILALPHTAAQGGWAMVVVLVLSAAAATYTGRLVIWNLYVRDVRLAGYPESAQEAFGAVGFYAVHILQKLTVMGVSTIFIIIAVGSAQHASGQLGLPHNPSVHAWTLIMAAAVALPTILPASVTELKFSSAFGLFVIVFVTVGVAVVALCDTKDIPDGQDRSHKVIDIVDFPSAFSTVSLSFGGHACFPTIQAEMVKHGISKERFVRSMDLAFLALTALYVPMMVVAYGVYGNSVASPVLNSLPTHGSNGVMTAILQLSIMVHVIMAFPILQHVVIDQLEVGLGLKIAFDKDDKLLGSPNVGTTVRRLSIRTLLWGACTLMAYFVPYFGDFMTLVGAFCVVSMVYFFPCAIAIKLHLDNNRVKGVSNTRNDYLWIAGLTVIMLLAIVGAVIGVEQAINALAADF